MENKKYEPGELYDAVAKKIACRVDNDDVQQFGVELAEISALLRGTLRNLVLTMPHANAEIAEIAIKGFDQTVAELEKEGCPVECFEVH